MYEVTQIDLSDDTDFLVERTDSAGDDLYLALYGTEGELRLFAGGTDLIAFLERMLAAARHAAKFA